MDDYVIIHSLGEEKTNKIFVPQTGTYSQRMQWLSNDNIVYAVADNVKCVEKGDKIVLKPHTKMRGIDNLTKIMEEKLGKKLTIEIVGKNNQRLGSEEKEKYFIVDVSEKDIMCIVN